MSAVSIVGSLGIPAVVAAAITVGGGAFLTYRYGLRKLRDEYEMEQQRELRKLMGEYTGRMLEAAVDWDRRMMQLYKYWTKPDENAPPQDDDEDDPDIGWHMMCPGRGGPPPKRWRARALAKFSRSGDRFESEWFARARRDPEQYFYLSVVFRFLSLLAIARRFEAEAFYLDARHLEDHTQELYFLRYAKGFLWAVTHSELSPHDGMPARDHFLSDKLRPMLDLCYKDIGSADSKAPEGQPIFDWGRFLVLMEHKADNKNEYDPDINQLLEFFYELRPVDYFDDHGKIVKRRRWERLVCLHLLTVNFIATFGFPWQSDPEKIEESLEAAIRFLSMDNAVIDAFVKGSQRWLGLEEQGHMKKLCETLTRTSDEKRAMKLEAATEEAVRALIDIGAEKVAEPALLQDKEGVLLQDKAGLRFEVNQHWLEHIGWQDKRPPNPAAEPEP
jgi:hypothetical protein